MMSAVLHRRRAAYSEASSPVRPKNPRSYKVGSGSSQDVWSEPPMPEWKRPMSPTRSLKRGTKSTLNWLADIYGSLFKVIFLLTGTTRTAVKVMQKKTPSFRNLKRLQKKAVESVSMDKKIWGKAAVALSLLFFASMAVYFFIHSISHVAKMTVHVRSANATEQTGTVTFQLTKEDDKILDESIHNIVGFAVDEKVVELEDALHRANQRFCIPYISTKFTLDKDSLTRLDTELLLLVDLIATKRVELSDYHDEEHTLVVESDGKLSFVETQEWRSHKDTTVVAMECPLVSQLYEYTQSKSHIDLPQKKDTTSGKEEADVMTAAEFMAMIDDNDGTINGDIQSIVYSILNVVSDGGPCSDTGKSLGLANTPAQMRITPGLRTLFKDFITYAEDPKVNFESPVFVNSLGEVFIGKQTKKTARTQCDDLANIVKTETDLKGVKRVKAAILSLLAHLFNVNDGDSVSTLLLKHTPKKPEPKPAKDSNSVFKTENKKTKPSKKVTSTEQPAPVQKKVPKVQKQKPLTEKTVNEIGQLVEDITGDNQVRKVFEENRVDGALFTELTEDVLKSDFGLKQWGIRQKIIKYQKEN